MSLGMRNFVTLSVFMFMLVNLNMGMGKGRREPNHKQAFYVDASCP